MLFFVDHKRGKLTVMPLSCWVPSDEIVIVFSLPVTIADLAQETSATIGCRFRHGFSLMIYKMDQTDSGFIGSDLRQFQR